MLLVLYWSSFEYLQSMQSIGHNRIEYRWYYELFHKRKESLLAEICMLGRSIYHFLVWLQRQFLPLTFVWFLPPAHSSAHSRLSLSRDQSQCFRIWQWDENLKSILKNRDRNYHLWIFLHEICSFKCLDKTRQHNSMSSSHADPVLGL